MPLCQESGAPEHNLAMSREAHRGCLRSLGPLGALDGHRRRPRHAAPGAPLGLNSALAALLGRKLCLRGRHGDGERLKLVQAHSDSIRCLKQIAANAECIELTL